MSVFERYSAYYDLLYQDKDYGGEVSFLLERLEEHSDSLESILEFGCGTGKHGLYLARSGKTVCGVDSSRHMLAEAGKRLADCPPSLRSKISFSLGDIRTVRLAEKFDAVIALFHVVSYLPTNADLLSAFSTARCHLKEGGLFLFDCWYGPAVLSDGPEKRSKIMEDNRLRIERQSTPVMHLDESFVDVQYHAVVTDKDTGETEEIEEMHRMRYLFTPEIRDLFVRTDFTLLEHAEWLTRRRPGPHTWGVYYLGRAGTGKEELR